MGERFMYTANAIASVRDGVCSARATHDRAVMVADVVAFREAVQKWNQARVVNRVRLDSRELIVNDDTPIFRYMRAGHLLQALEKRYWALSHISKWDDPFEGFVFKRAIHNHSRIDVQSTPAALYKDYFGQSWTFEKKESDVRWRAYCPDRDGVRIKTTIGKLKTIVGNVFGEDMHVCCLCSPVHYFPDKEADALMATKTWRDFLPQNRYDAFKLLFAKKKYFEDECEYRVIANPMLGKGNYPRKDLYGHDGFLFLRMLDDVRIAFLKEILIDPRMRIEETDRFLCQLAQYDVQCNVSQTNAYKWPCFKIEK